MPTRTLTACCITLASLTAACGTDKVTEVVLEFPSERAFVLAEQGELEVYDADARCTELLLKTSRAPVRYSTGVLPLCAFLEGDPRTHIVVEERGDFVVLAKAMGADSRRVLMRGCRRFTGGSELVVTLSPALGDATPSTETTTCDDAAAYCRGDCER